MIPFALEEVVPKVRPAAAPALVVVPTKTHRPYTQLPAVDMFLDFTGEADLEIHESMRVQRLRAAAAASPNHNFCGCGLVRQLCSCGEWVCGAPGHLVHRCAAVLS